MRGMNKLPAAKRAQILHLLVEGSSMRSVARVADVSINTVFKLQADAGKACAAFHDEMVRNVRAKRVQCDEIWSFVYAKAKNVKAAKAAPEEAGDVWTWTAHGRRYQADRLVAHGRPGCRLRLRVHAGRSGPAGRACSSPRTVTRRIWTRSKTLSAPTWTTPSS